MSSTGRHAQRRLPYPRRMLVAWLLVIAAVAFGFYLNAQTAERVEMEGAIRNYSLCESVNDLRAEIRAFLAALAERPGGDDEPGDTDAEGDRRDFIRNAFQPEECPPLPEGWDTIRGPA